ncbi:MAG TPA: ABC-type transport auxiliary lipoprotein family protein [Rheinheimera sp.]|nr:ABC-type transport auxiliary lipoprotein family protein [Rheinheimera sp.]
MKYTLAGLLILLAGCSSQQAVTYYQLPDVLLTSQGEIASASEFYVEPVQVVSYLNGRGLVLQQSDVELVVARQHIWAEALDQQLQRQLTDRLQLQLTDYVVTLQPKSSTLRIAVQLDGFHGLADGYAIVSGRYAISKRKGAAPFAIRVALTDDGYPALVAALAQGLQQLSQQIARQLNNPV